MDRVGLSVAGVSVRPCWHPGKPSAVIDVPVRGRWDDETTGRFYCDDVHEGTPVRVRYLWLRSADERLRWEQAFSVDRGRTWETNRIMESVRSD